MPKSTGEYWMGTTDVMAYLGIMLRTLYKLIDEGQLPAYKFGRAIRLKREDVEAFVERSRIQPGELRHLYGGVVPQARQHSSAVRQTEPKC